MIKSILPIVAFIFCFGAHAAESYRERSIGDVVPNSKIRLLKGSIEKAEPGWEPAPIFYKFFLQPGEMRTYKNGSSTLTIQGREPLSSWERDYKEVVQLGYRPTLSALDRFRLEGRFQAGRSSAEPLLQNQPFCTATNLTDLMPLSAGLGDGRPDNSEWPKMRVLNVSIGFQRGQSSLDLDLVNANKGSDEQYSIKCFSSDEEQRWSIGLIEDIFKGRLLFKEAQFIDQGERDLPLGQLAKFNLRVLQEIPKGKQYIVSGRLFSAEEMTLENLLGPNCYLSDLDENKTRPLNRSLKSGDGRVANLSAYSLSTVESWFHDSRFPRRSEVRDNLVVFAKIHTSNNLFVKGLRVINSSLGGYSIQCSIGINDSLVSINKLNDITRGYILFERTAP